MLLKKKKIAIGILVLSVLLFVMMNLNALFR
jgi:hypothetical protein